MQQQQREEVLRPGLSVAGRRCDKYKGVEEGESERGGGIAARAVVGQKERSMEKGRAINAGQREREGEGV